MEEVSVLIAKSQQGDKEAREVLIEKNLGLVHAIVRRFIGRGVETEDLFQIGTIGLIKAIDNFDLSFDVKFSTYAVPLITGEIKRFLRDDGIVKVSRTIKEQGQKFLCSHFPAIEFKGIAKAGLFAFSTACAQALIKNMYAVFLFVGAALANRNALATV